MSENHETVFENKRPEDVRIYTERGDVLRVVRPGEKISVGTGDPKGLYARWSKITFLPYRDNGWLEFSKRPGFEEPDLGSEFCVWFLNSEGDDLEELWVDGGRYFLPKGIPVRIGIKDLSDPWVLAESVELRVTEQREKSKENPDYFVRVPLKNWTVVRTRNDDDLKKIRELRKAIKP